MCQQVGDRLPETRSAGTVQAEERLGAVMTGTPITLSADAECKEAWVTVLADDAFLPGVLVLLHSIRQVRFIDPGRSSKARLTGNASQLEGMYAYSAFVRLNTLFAVSGQWTTHFADQDLCKTSTSAHCITDNPKASVWGRICQSS